MWGSLGITNVSTGLLYTCYTISTNTYLHALDGTIRHETTRSRNFMHSLNYGTLRPFLTQPIVQYIYIHLMFSLRFCRTQTSADFEYVDVWSSRFTWGGLDPPTEGDFVVIPASMTIILDTVTPVLKMLLIQGMVVASSFRCKTSN